LLSKNLVLTAGHCCEYEGYFQAWTGLTRARIYAQTSSVSQRFVHPNYTTAPLSTDLCVLLLSTNIMENEYTKYVSIINTSAFEEWSENKECITSVAMGFGYQGVKYKNDTPKDPNTSFNPVMQCVELTVIPPDICDLGMDDSMFCAIGPLSKERDPCQGDSGGPLICKNVQIGIISAGFGCGREGYASIYTRVDIFGDYLRSIILRSNAEIFFIKIKTSLIIFCTVV
ncbi:Trypsin, partial [Oryctes borbonicus]